MAGQAVELWEAGATMPAATIVLPEDEPGLGDAPRPDARVWIEGLGFSADGRALAAVRRSDGRIRGFVIDVEARSVRPLAGKLPVPALALAPDGSLAVAGPLEVDGSIVVFSGPKLARSVLLPAHAGVGRVYLARFDPHQPRLLTAGDGAAATLWTVENGILSAPRPLPLGGGGDVQDALFLADGKLVIAADRRISVWSGEPLAPWGTPITPPTRGTAALAAVGADGLQVAALSLADAPIHVFDPRRMAPWQLAAPQVPMTEGGGAAFQGVAPRVAIDRAGARVAATSFNRHDGARVTVLDLASGASVAAAAGQAEQFMALAFADADKLVSIDAAGTVLAWTIPGGEAETMWKLPQRPQRVALGVDPAGRTVAASVAREATHVTLTAQDPAAAESSPRTSTIAVGVPITALALDHVAGRIAVATCSERIGLATCRLGEVRVFAVAGGAQVAGPLAVDAGVRGLVFAADGRRLAALVPGAPPAVWQVGDGERLALTVRRSLGEFIAADFSADGAVLLASAEADNAAVALTIWDLRSGEELAPPLVAHNPAVGSFDPHAARSVLLAPHSGLVVSGSFDGVLLWDIADEALAGRACALARRELTPAEWTRFLGRGEPQQALCGGR